MNVAAEIFDLLDAEGQSAPDMTKALKTIGGSMKEGIKRIGEVCAGESFIAGKREGMRIGEKKGMRKGSIITLGLVVAAEGVFYLCEKYKDKKQLESQTAAGQEIVDALKAAIPDVENSEPSIQAQSEIEQEENPPENTGF